MNDVWIQVLEKYGLFGFMLVAVFIFSGWVMRRVVNHFIENIVRKDDQITEMSGRFTAALDANTKAIHELAQTEEKRSLTSEGIISGFNLMANQSKLEHSEILEYVRRKSQISG